jgi:amidophosphoribosyltransferase
MCGLVWLRLRWPLSAYESPVWGLQKATLLLSKMRNRGQDGAGILCYKGEVPPGQPYFHLRRRITPLPSWRFLVQEIWEEWEAWQKTHQAPEAFPFVGVGYLAHLRYGTFGGYTLEETHPVMRLSSWPAKSLTIAGNFNLTNTPALFERLLELGQHPLYSSDTYIILERMGHFLDKYVEELYQEAKERGLSKREATAYIRDRFPVGDWLARSARRWDGGYVIGGFVGMGWGFVLRDPAGIRPAYYYADDRVIAVASEAAALHNVFGTELSQVQELPPGHALIANPAGEWEIRPTTEHLPPPARCTFERIYFSRGNSPNIYQERQHLGRLLANEVYKRISHHPSQVVYTYVPNTSETAFLGLIQEMTRLYAQNGHPLPLRAEKLIWKDAEGRTFIASPILRKDLSTSAYDVVLGIVKPQDTLVCIDDSIVRGTTLRQTLLPTLARLRPARILFLSSAPQIRYPDFYGIDMSSLEELIAFQAVIALLRETHQTELLEHTYQLCKKAQNTEEFYQTNFVRALYAPFTETQIAAKIAEMVTPPGFDIPLEIIFQPVENLPRLFTRHTGMWYFTGQYPTPGGYAQVNRAFLLFYEARATRRTYETLST